MEKDGKQQCRHREADCQKVCRRDNIHGIFHHHKGKSPDHSRQDQAQRCKNLDAAFTQIVHINKIPSFVSFLRTAH